MKNTEENGNSNATIINYSQNTYSNRNRKNKNKRGKHYKKNAVAFKTQLGGDQEENKVSDSPNNNFENRSKNEHDLIDNFQINSSNNKNEKENTNENNNVSNNINNNTNNLNNKIDENIKTSYKEEENIKLINNVENSSTNNSYQRKNIKENEKSLKKTNEENFVRENLIIINDKACSENTSPQIRKIDEDIFYKSMEKRNSQSSSNSTSSKNEKTNLNDSTGGLKADKAKENLDESKSNFSKIRHREDSILTEIQENLNDNYSSITKFFVKESSQNLNNPEDSITEGSKAENVIPICKDNNFGASNGAGVIDSISSRKMQLKLFLDKALEYKLLANDYFKKNKFNDAIREYINVILIFFLY